MDLERMDFMPPCLLPACLSSHEPFKVTNRSRITEVNRSRLFLSSCSHVQIHVCIQIYIMYRVSETTKYLRLRTDHEFATGCCDEIYAYDDTWGLDSFLKHATLPGLRRDIPRRLISPRTDEFS